jgi:hypothetical protein
MAKRNNDEDGVFTAEEVKKVEEVEKAPIEELKYEIVQT